MFSGYRTVVFNIVMAIIALVHALNPSAELPGADQITSGIDMFLAALAVVWGIGGVVLRAITSSPIFKKKEN